MTTIDDTTTPTTDDTSSGYTAPASQADLDRIINDRLSRERAKFADHADLKAKAARLDAIETANASDLEKAVKAARTEGETEASTRANARIVKAEARALAATAKFRDPADAVAFLDLSSIAVDANGDVDVSAVQSLLDTLATAKPYLLDVDAADDTVTAVTASLDLGGNRTSSKPTGNPAGDFAKFLNGQRR